MPPVRIYMVLCESKEDVYIRSISIVYDENACKNAVCCRSHEI